MNLILLGGPGSGKGTQSQLLQEKFHIPGISTGQILREACRQKTALGLQAESYINHGQLVPDEIAIEIIVERLKQPDCRMGYILDGFPRTVVQAEALADILNRRGDRVNAVINIGVPQNDLIARLTGRRLCRQCGAGYHTEFSPPQKTGVCDRCHGSLYQREDDREDTIIKRLKVYVDQTAPLIDYYTKANLLLDLDGARQPAEVFAEISEALSRLKTTAKGSSKRAKLG